MLRRDLTVASRIGANFQSSKGVVAREGIPAREGMASAFLNSLGVLSIACARTALTDLTGATGRDAELQEVRLETFMRVAIVDKDEPEGN